MTPPKIVQINCNLYTLFECVKLQIPNNFDHFGLNIEL